MAHQTLGVKPKGRSDWLASKVTDHAGERDAEDVLHQEVDVAADSHHAASTPRQSGSLNTQTTHKLVYKML